jgi:hypothetical protein
MTSILEQILSVPTASQNPNSSGSSSPDAPFSLFQALGMETSNGNGIIGLLLSIALLVIRSDWAKLAILGGAFESFRRGTSWLYSLFWESIFLNAYFQEDDPTFGMCMSFVSVYKDKCSFIHRLDDGLVIKTAWLVCVLLTFKNLLKMKLIPFQPRLAT